MLSFEEYVDCDLVGWGERIGRGEVAAEEVLEAAIARAEAVDPHVNAVVERLYDEARRNVAAGLGGAFAGAPFVVKDLYPSIAGVRFTNGSRAFDGLSAETDSELVRRFKAAGLTVFATSTSPELAVSAVTESTLNGITRNPWDLGRTSGGSSGGASALVAAGVVPAAHATDGGGSIRGPASCCGLVGLKPSRGRVPMAPGRTEGWFGCSTSHAVTRSVRDSAALLDATHGPEPGSRYVAPPPHGRFVDAVARDPGRLRIALHWETAPGVTPDPECVRAAQAAGKLCETLGHEVELAAPRLDREALGRAFGVSVLSSIALAAQARARVLGVEIDEVVALMEQTNREYLGFAERFTAVHLLMANDAFMSAAIEMARFQETYDLILTPTMGRPPIPVGEGTLAQPSAGFDKATSAFSCFTAVYNQTGQPAVSLPLHQSPDGLPVGVQFAARLGEEELLFSISGQLERAAPWFGRRPAL